MHANLSEKMIITHRFILDLKHILILICTNKECMLAMRLLTQLKESVTYYASLKKLPMMPPSINMRTAEGPMKKMIEWAKQAEAGSRHI